MTSYAVNSNALFFFFSTGRTPPLDVAFLADSTTGVNWRKTLSAISNILSSFDVSQSGTHIGFIPYSSSARVAVPFPSADVRPYNPTAVIQSIISFAQQGGSDRRLDLAFQTARNGLFTSQNRSRQAVKRVSNQFYKYSEPNKAHLYMSLRSLIFCRSS